MEEFLQDARTKLSRNKQLNKVHVVLGEKSSDLDSLISAITYAYYLQKVSPPGVLCLPVLNIPRREFYYSTEIRLILEELNIPESLHVFRDEINLYQLNSEGKLSLTLVNSSALTSEDNILESAVVRVINPEERCDGNLGLLESSTSLVAKAILQEAPQLITQQLAHLLRGSILFKTMAVAPENISEEQKEVLLSLEKKFPELLPREDIIIVLQEARFRTDGLSLEEALIKDLKEVSDGEIKVAVTTVYMSLEEFLFHRDVTGNLKAFVEKYGLDVLVILTSYLSEEGQEKRQVAVYSENMELGNQICCELEECQTPCLELDPLEYGSDQLLTYQQENAVAHSDEIFLLMKDVVSRRHPAMAPNSRTSSTEAVAGSAPLSQGSSGIMELYGSDIEPQPNAVNFIENPQDHNESAHAHADVNIDLVSPDSGLATIRSSRSSKESSVFLSDDSPVGEGAASHHSFLSGFDSYSPIPEGAIAEEENPQSRNGSENLDLFSFDLVPMATVQTESSHSVDCSPGDDFFHDSGSSEGQLPHDSKVLDETNLAECDNANYSSDLLLTTREGDDLAKFDKCNLRQENPRSFSERKSSRIDLENDSPSCPEVLKNVDRRTPPTRVNSLVESSPLDSEPSLFYPQDITKKNNEMDCVKSSQSRVRYGSWWDGFELNSKNADAWSSADHESVFQSPNSWKNNKADLLLRQQADRRSSDSICMQKQSKHTDLSRASIWENRFSAVPDKHALGCQQKENEPQMEDYASNTWQANQVVPAISGSWDSTTKNGGPTNMNSSNVWETFDHDVSGHSESAWNVPQMDFGQMSLKNLDTWALSNSSPSNSPEPSAVNEHLNNKVDLGSENKGQDCIIQEYRAYENTKSDIGNLQNNVQLATNHKNTAHKPKQFDNAGCWDVYDTDIRKVVLGNLVPWEDPFLSYRESDFIASNTQEDVIVSPPDTNYSTSDSYVSPTGIGDERESEGKLPDREPEFDQMINLSLCESKTYNIADKESLPPSPITPSISSDGNSDLWKVPLNNEKQMETVNSEVTMVTETNVVLLDSEPKAATCFSEDYFVDESSLSSSEDGEIMLASKEKNSHSPQYNIIPGVEEKADTCSKSILDDIWCPHLETRDLESVISVSYEIKGSEESEKGSAFQDEQLNGEDEELQQDQWARGENDDISPASLQEILEDNRSDERNRQVILKNIPNNIRNEIIQNDSISLPLTLPLSGTNSSEVSKTTPDYPSSPERTRSSGSPEEVAAEINLSFLNQTHSLHEEMSLDSNAECFPRSPSERNIHLAQFDIDGGPKDGFDVASPSVSEHIDKDLSPDKEVTGQGSLSPCSPGEAQKQGKQSPIIGGNQDVGNELKQKSPQREASHSLLHEMSEPIGEYEEHLSDESMSNLNICSIELENIENISEMNCRLETPLENKQSEILQSPYAEYVESFASTDVPATNNSLFDEMDSCETTGPSENLFSENKLSNDKCIDIIPHHELSQILDAWNISVNEYAKSVDISPEISDSLERSDTVSSFPEDIPLKSACREDKEDNACSGFIPDDTHSSATNPDISDSLANVSFWDNLQAANNKKVNERVWDVPNNGEIEVSGKESSENKSQEDSETSTDHKVPKNLDLWNTHVEDDTVSSLSSPGIDEVSESLNGHQAEVQSDLQSNELENNSFRKEDCLQFSETNIAIDSGSSGAPPNLEENNHVNALNETSEELDASWDNYVNEVSEHLAQRETTQGEVHVSTANEQPRRAYTWNSCVMNTAQITVVSDEENNASDNSDAWNALLQGHSESTLGKDQMCVTEALGFSDDSSEWWNSQVQGENSMESQQFGSDDDFKTNDTEVTAHEAVLMKINKKPKESNLTDSTCDQNEPLQPNSEGECNNEKLSLAIQKDELDKDNANIEECGSSLPLRKAEKDMEEDPFVPVDREQMTLKQADPEDWSSSYLLAQVDPALGLLGDNMTVTSSNSNEVKFDQKLLDTSEKYPGVPPLPLKTGRVSTPSCDEDRVPQQKTFVPDILQNNTPGDCQAFTVDPDLWTEVEQPFILRTNRENPDILSHCDQDSSSQASSSPDVCHEYESKQTCAQSSVLAEPEEATQMFPSLSGIHKDTDFDFNQQLRIDRGELCLEGEGSCLPDNYEAGFDEFYQLTSPRTEEPSKIGRKNSIVQESDIANKTIELVGLASSCTGSLEVVSINLEDSALEKKSTEEKEDAASTDITVDHYVTPASPADDSIHRNFSENDHIFIFDHTTEVVDQMETPNLNEVKRDHHINKISVTNNPSTMLNEIDHMPMIDSESEEVEMNSILTNKKSLQASLEEEGEYFLYGAGSQYATDIMQESVNLPENHSPWFVGSPNIQSPFVYTSPFDASLDREFILQKGDMNLPESHTTDIKCEGSGCSPGDQDWGSLLVESEVAPGSSCILKGFDSETESRNIDSPGVGNEMNSSVSKACDVKGEVAECPQEDQGWGSFLLESESPESSCVLNESECETHSSDTLAGRGEKNLSEDKQNDVSGKAGKYSQEDQDWGSLLLESEETPKSTDTLKEFEYETESANIDSPADGVISMTNAVACDALNTEDKGCKSTDSPDMIRTESGEDTKREAEDQSFLEMDYVLITGEENLSLRKDTSVTQESNFTSQEVAAAVKQTDCLETFSADSSDTLQSISITNKSEGQPTLETEWDSFCLAEKSFAVVPQKLGDEKKSPRSPIQDQEWTVVGQSGVDDISPEESHSRTDTIESLSRQSTKEFEDVLSQDLICETQAGSLLGKSPHKSLEQEGKNSHNSRTATLFSQVVSGNDELDVLSGQHSGGGIVAEHEIEEETQFVDREIEVSHMPKFFPEHAGMDIAFNETVLGSSATDMRPEPPNSLDLDGSHPRRIKLAAPNINLSLDQSEGSVLSDDNLDTPDEIDINVDDLDTPDEADSFEYAGHEEQPAVRNAVQEETESIPEYTAEEEREDNRLWRTVVIGEQEQRIDMKAIEPYKRVISHGGYYGDGANAIIVFAACFLPDSIRTDYNYVMENLFLYVISTLELMVAEDYMIVYLNGATPRRKMPGLGWLKRCYQMIDRRLRKNLKSFIIVHPSWFIRTILAVTRPFISSKFSNKIQYVNTLAELNELIPMEYVNLPECIVKYDEDRGIQRRVRASCLSNEPEITSVQQDIDVKLKGNA